MQDFYEILGVPRDADEAALRAAYRRKAEQLHPDRIAADTVANSDPFKQLRWAYEVLAKPATRADYDQHPHRYGYFRALGSLDAPARDVSVPSATNIGRNPKLQARTAGDIARRIGRDSAIRKRQKAIGSTLFVFAILLAVAFQAGWFSSVWRTESPAWDVAAPPHVASFPTPSPNRSRSAVGEPDLSTKILEVAQRLGEMPSMPPNLSRVAHDGTPLDSTAAELARLRDSDRGAQPNPEGTTSEDTLMRSFPNQRGTNWEGNDSLTFQLPPEPDWAKTAWERSQGPSVRPIVPSAASALPIDSAWSPPVHRLDWGGKPPQVRFSFPTEEASHPAPNWQAAREASHSAIRITTPPLPSPPSESRLEFPTPADRVSAIAAPAKLHSLAEPLRQPTQP